MSNAVEYFLPAGLGGLQGVSGSLIATLGEKGATAAGQTRGNGFRLGWAGAGWNVAGAQFTTRNTLSGIHFKDQELRRLLRLPAGSRPAWPSVAGCMAWTARSTPWWA